MTALSSCMYNAIAARSYPFLVMAPDPSTSPSSASSAAFLRIRSRRILLNSGRLMFFRIWFGSYSATSRIRLSPYVCSAVWYLLTRSRNMVSGLNEPMPWLMASLMSFPLSISSRSACSTVFISLLLSLIFRLPEISSIGSSSLTCFLLSGNITGILAVRMHEPLQLILDEFLGRLQIFDAGLEADAVGQHG